ncbi:MAG: SDR family NAD(P)-dependent oxidoreductase [Flavobacteriales bacterium]|nr:SDR family NAD(P)-dependent oxidoreductase [Flavobacteriales bacterium]MDW8409490.1 SDR family NAD(P)-dependent oxidoreductase [Flavobacteriales bacterium]
MSKASPPVVFITGATSGIGYQTALQLAVKDFEVIFTGRNEQKVRATLDALQTVNPRREHRGYVAELTLVKEAERLANQLLRDLVRLDVIISNSGAVYTRRQETSEGLEYTFALNHMAPFVLVRRLIPLLRQNGGGRVVMVSSHSHYSARLDLDDLQAKKGYSALRQYANTKMMNILFANALDRRYGQEGIRANSLHPGVVRTGIGYKHSHIPGRVAWWLFTRFKGISVEAGARTPVFLATAPDGIEKGGKYYSNCREKQPHPLVLNLNLQEALWARSETIEQEIMSK